MGCKLRNTSKQKQQHFFLFFHFWGEASAEIKPKYLQAGVSESAARTVKQGTDRW
jgi:hypothetical protein